MELLLNGLYQAWVTMAGVQHGDARSKIDILLPFYIRDGAIFCRLGKEITHHTYSTWSSSQTTLMEFVITHFFIPRTQNRFTG